MRMPLGLVVSSLATAALAEADVVWPTVVPETKEATESQIRPVGPYWNAKVALTNEVAKRFMLKAKPVAAWIQFAGPGVTAFVNGRATTRNGYYRGTVCWDVRDLLKAGENEIVLKNGSKSDWARWIRGELFERQPDGSYEKICCGDDLPPELLGSDPTLPPYEGSIRLDYTDLAHPQTDVAATAEPAAVKGGEPVKFTFTFSGDTLPEFPFEARLVYRMGNSVRWTDRISVEESQVTARDGKRWSLEIVRNAPRYIALKEAQVKLEAHALFRIAGTKRLAATVSVEPPKTDPAIPAPVRASVVRVAGQPVFALDGKPFYVFWGSGSRNRPDFTRRHSDAPLNLMTMGGRSNEWWPKTDVLDFSVFDREAEELSVHNPDAYFMANLSVYPPPDWCAANPGEMACDADGRTCTSWIGPYSFSSEKALALMENVLAKAIDYLERSPYANRIIGYRVNSGNTIEWLGWDPPQGGRHPLDFSEAERRGFGRAIPPAEARAANPSGELIWEEREHRETVAYHRYVSDTVADDLIRMCMKAKAVLGGRKLVGTYYGYVMTLWSGGIEHMRGHFSLKKVIDSRAVDFLMSPQPYTVRNLGDAYGDMKPFATLAANGIVPVIEDDTRTFVGLRLPPVMENNLQMPTEETTVGILRRNLGFTLCRNQIPYYIPICSGMEFDFPRFAADAAEARRIGEKCWAAGTARKAEIAVVMSEETIKAMPVIRGFSTTAGETERIYRRDGSVRKVTVSGTPFAMDPFCSAYTRYARIGAPVDYVLAEDLKDHPGDYRLYLFVNCYHVDDAFRAAVEGLKRRACTLAWLSAPGYMSADGNSTEAMGRLTGFTFAKRPGTGQPELTMADGRKMGAHGSAVAPLFTVTDGTALGRWDDGSVGAAVCRTGEATSVYCGTFQTDLPFLRDLAARAGVHVYSASGDPVEANDRLVCLHARTAGRKTIVLPRTADVYDVFGRKTVAKGVRTFSFDAPLHSSWLFLCR